jgi:DNA-binding MarR family transcriptional regulator
MNTEENIDSHSDEHHDALSLEQVLEEGKRRGYVRRLADPDDRRGVIVELTDEGREVVDAAVAALAISDRQLMERLDPHEVEQLESLLRKVLALLELPE